MESNEAVNLAEKNTSKIAIEIPIELDEQISTMMHKADGSTEWTCSVCGKDSKQKANIRQHIEANHIEGVSHPCNQCEKVSRSIALLVHIMK